MLDEKCEQVLVFSNKIVLMQTAKLQKYPTCRSQPERQRSYIAEVLATKIGLQAEADQNLTLATVW